MHRSYLFTSHYLIRVAARPDTEGMRLIDRSRISLHISGDLPAGSKCPWSIGHTREAFKSQTSHTSALQVEHMFKLSKKFKPAPRCHPSKQQRWSRRANTLLQGTFLRPQLVLLHSRDVDGQGSQTFPRFCIFIKENDEEGPCLSRRLEIVAEVVEAGNFYVTDH